MLEYDYKVFFGPKGFRMSLTCLRVGRESRTSQAHLGFRFAGTLCVDRSGGLTKRRLYDRQSKRDTQ